MASSSNTEKIELSSSRMANTRSIARKQKTCSTFDSDGSTSWSNLDHDLLFLIMTYMGVFDFIAMKSVCKSWRSVAVNNWNKFMLSKQPMHLFISTRSDDKDCYLEDYTRRKFKTTIPHSNGRVCLGVTCGYLIFYGEQTHDFWLVNPFTRKELYFPNFPLRERFCPPSFRGILVFSPSMSGWVFVVVLHMYTSVVSFSLAGEKARWRSRSITSGSYIRDLHLFKGKLYMIDNLKHLWELRLNPEPTLTLHKMKNFPCLGFNRLEFVNSLSSSENLYVCIVSPCVPPYMCLEVDFDEMKWVDSERTLGEYTVFVNHFVKGSAAIKPSTWTHPWTQYERLNYSVRKGTDRGLTDIMWYFPHECLNDDESDTENGVLLNILKE